MYKDLWRRCTAIAFLIKLSVKWRSRYRRRRDLLKLPIEQWRQRRQGQCSVKRNLYVTFEFRSYLDQSSPQITLKIAQT